MFQPEPVRLVSLTQRGPQGIDAPEKASDSRIWLLDSGRQLGCRAWRCPNSGRRAAGCRASLRPGMMGHARDTCAKIWHIWPVPGPAERPARNQPLGSGFLWSPHTPAPPHPTLCASLREFWSRSGSRAAMASSTLREANEANSGTEAKRTPGGASFCTVCKMFKRSEASRRSSAPFTAHPSTASETKLLSSNSMSRTSCVQSLGTQGKDERRKKKEETTLQRVTESRFAEGQEVDIALHERGESHVMLLFSL